MMLILIGCIDHNVQFPGDSKSGDTDVEWPPDADSDSDTDTDTGPALCVGSTWAWGAELTVDDADGSLLPEGDVDWAGGALGLPGDIDGDGVHDLVVGAPDFAGVAAESGKLYLLTGLARGADQQLADFPSFLGFEEHMQLSTIAPVGDANADGLADFIVVPGYSWQAVSSQYLVLGTSTPRAHDVDIRDADGSVTETTGVVSTDFGAMGTLGDYDGDGRDDLLLADWGGNDGQLWVMTALGGDQGVPADAAVYLHGDDGSMLVAPVGDLDGDGRADIAGTAHSGSETISILLGGSTPTAGSTLAAAAEANIYDLDLNGAEGLDDLDGDGTAELVTRIYSPSHEDLDLYLFLGGQTAWAGALEKDSASVHITATPAIGSVDSLGDLNGDGIAELGITAGESGGPHRDLYVFFGRDTWPATLDLSEADVQISAPATGEDSLHLPARNQRGDLNGDGIGDLLIPIAQGSINGINGSGVVYLFLGRTTWDPLNSIDDHDLRWVGTEWNQSMGTTMVVDDLDGDGCDDVVASSYYHPVDRPDGAGEVFIFNGQN